MKHIKRLFLGLSVLAAFAGVIILGACAFAFIGSAILWVAGTTGVEAGMTHFVDLAAFGFVMTLFAAALVSFVYDCGKEFFG